MSLKSMAANTALGGVKKTDLFKVDPRLLKEEPGFNLRDYDDPDVQAHIEGFATSYLEGRYVPPILVRTVGDDIVPIEGHCRRLGALLAIERGAEGLMISATEFKGSDAERVTVMLRSADGLPLKVLEQATGCLRLIRMGFTNAQVAKEAGRTTARVEQLLILATANMDVQLLVKSGKVAADAAIEAVRMYREKAGEHLQALLGMAEQDGKHKVTKGILRPRALPPKVVTQVVTSVETLIAGFDRSTRRQLAELEKLDPEQLTGRKVEVEATAVLALLQAGHQVADVRERRASAKASAAAATSQQELLGR
jgi:ParB family transcriptional regulator, chromosome partitioning protein